MIVDLIEALYRLLWGDLFTLPVAGGIGISFMVVLLFAAGIGFTLRTRLLPVRLFRDMIGAVCEKKQTAGGLSSFQTLVISTATRVGMGNLVGVVAAVSAGGAGAVFWMWVTALLGASTSFVESTLAQKYRVPDPLYGGWRGGPAYYLHVLAERKRGKKLKRSVCAALFAVSGLICWCGISQVISNSVSSAFENAFHVPPLATTVVLTLLAALIVLRKNATVKSLDFIVPVMAVCYFVITVGIVVLNLRQLPAVLARIFAEAFGLRQVAAGGFGAVLMNGVKRGLFSNEAGSGSAPCAAAAAECDDPVKMGLVQALGVLIDTVVICSCTAFLMLLVPQDITAGLTGMDLLQTAMQYHLGSFGIVFIAVILALFSFSTFLGVLYYARGNVAYLCGDNWWSQTVYKLIALVMLLIGGLYLIWRKVINWQTPVAYIATVAVLTVLFPKAGGAEYMLYSIFGGGLFLGAFFMATDYATSPVTKKGQLIYGIGCGLFTVFIRYFGSYNEGVCYSIMVMNCCTALIDKYTKPVRFGVVKSDKKEAAAK